ncbi:MAG: gliding motility-associated ABC transporter permease subunit GldF [Sphingobacteriales bacterium]|nr:gliding motility-associated ABC transporter permease subunit GldF [Sphingobacteriales bacterium]
MFSIFAKELHTYFGSLTAYLSVGIFLLVNGLLLWVFPDTNLLDYQNASLDYFFNITPWILMFLIPAVTMRLFAEEIKSGTLELLITRPLTSAQIVGGKFLAAWLLIAFAIVPTFIYYYSVYNLGNPAGNIDVGATNGSYMGLLLLAGAFAALGVFASSLSSNQVVAFIIAVFLCFFFYQGFDAFSKLPSLANVDYWLQNFGIYSHYESISRGVVDSRDMVYFASFIFFFLFLSQYRLDKRAFL